MVRTKRVSFTLRVFFHSKKKKNAWSMKYKGGSRGGGGLHRGIGLSKGQSSVLKALLSFPGHHNELPGAPWDTRHF